MPMTPSTTVPDLPVNCDLALVRERLRRICDVHEEVSLADFLEDEEPVVTRERRRSSRARLQLPVTLVPVDWSCDRDDAVVICGTEQIGVTRDISPAGIGVTHDQLLGGEAAIVQFDLPGEGPVNLVLDLRWSVRQARYCFMSGGCIVGLLDLPAD